MATKTKSLLGIADDMLAIDELLMECEGDISDTDAAEAIDKWFAEAESNLDEKTDNYIGLMRQKSLLIAARKEEIERLQMMNKQDERSAKFLKERLQWVLERLGRKSAGKTRKATITKNGGKIPMEIDPVDPKNVPELYKKYQLTIDSDEVRRALEAGGELTFARLSERGTHLRIK
ncbi:MAG: siphovirus Gp157 family protein [Phycisphaeraceae bacterium]|nr:siphovirus Gp157 family protein [Phycisphaeraceae bacterium]